MIPDSNNAIMRVGRHLPINMGTQGGGGPPWLPFDLFSEGQAGFWPAGYDPSNVGLFVDNVGTALPTPGQTVGLVLDRSPRQDYGPELVVNGDFAAGAANWDLGSGWSMVSGRPQYSGATTGGLLTQTPWPGVNGKVYRTRVVADMLATPNALAMIRLNIGGSGQNIILDSQRPLTNAQRVEFVRFGAPTTVSSWMVRLGSSANYQMDFALTSVSIREVPGFQAMQAVVGSRPTLRQAMGFSYLENDGNDSLPIILPAGTYGRAWMDASRNITVDTVVNPTDTLAAQGAGATQFDIVLRQGEFSSAEEAKLRKFWSMIW